MNRTKSVSEKATLDLDRYVPGLLLWLSNKLSSSASQVYRRKYGIGVTDWRVLAFVELYPWSTGTQACQLMGIDKAAVSRSLAFLEAEGWLKSRPSGLRKIEYSTTAAGKKFYVQVLETARARENALLAGYTEKERALLIDFLHRMLVNLRAVDQVGADDT